MTEKHALLNFPEFIEAVERVGNNIAGAITPLNTAASHDATGGLVSSLTEAVMRLTAAMVQIADAITDVAVAMREAQSDV